MYSSVHGEQQIYNGSLIEANDKLTEVTLKKFIAETIQ